MFSITIVSSFIQQKYVCGGVLPEVHIGSSSSRRDRSRRWSWNSSYAMPGLRLIVSVAKES